MFPGQAALSLPDDLQLRAALRLVRSFRGGFCLLPGSCVHWCGLGGGWCIGFLLVEGVVALRRALHGGLAAVRLRGSGAWAAECVREVSICNDKKGRAGLMSAWAPGSSQNQAKLRAGGLGHYMVSIMLTVTPSWAPVEHCWTSLASEVVAGSRLFARRDREASARPSIAWHFGPAAV